MATIKDVAALAGVSKSTVHYALNGKRSISEEVRQRVMAAVTELNYTASALGQRMREGRSYSLGMIAPQFPATDAAVMEMLTATASTASKSDYTLGIFIGQTPEQMLQLLRNQLVDGLILVETTHNDPRIEILRPTEYPFVLLGRTQNLEGLTSVDFDFEGAIFTAFEHLLKLGHQTIGFVDAHHLDEPDVENWFYIQQGFERALAQYRFEVVREPARLNAEDGYRATEALLSQNPNITAIVATGHAHIGAMRSLYHRNLRIPDDCSLIGITTAQVAGLITPRLTSVDIPLYQMSQTATQLLLKKLSGQILTKQIVFPAQVVERETTARPRLSRG